MAGSGSSSSSSVAAPAVAQFTDRVVDEETVCERMGCAAVIVVGDKAFYVQSLDDPRIEGRWVCIKRYQYYLEKGGKIGTSRRFPGMMHLLDSSLSL